MRDAAQASAKVREYGLEVLVRIALMQEYRFADGHRHFQLRDEGGSLRGGGREIAEIIEAAFADGDDHGLVQQFEQRVAQPGIETAGVMGMHARGAPERAGMGVGQRRRRARAGHVGPGHHLTRHAGGDGTRHDRRPIRGETHMGQIGSDIDQFHDATPPR